MAESAGSNTEKWWLPFYEFFMHIVMGTGVFLLLTVPAAGINIYVNYLITLRIDSFVIYLLIAVEYALLLCDVVLMLVFLLRTSLKMGRHLWAM
jgi:hypothetical protein